MFSIMLIFPLQRFPLPRGLQLLLMLIRLLPLPLRRLKLVSIDIILIFNVKKFSEFISNGNENSRREKNGQQVLDQG